MNDSATERRAMAAIQRTDLLARQNREDDALELLAEELRNFPDDPDLLAQRAWLLNRADRPAAALESARMALRTHPDHREALFQAAAAHLLNGDYAEAERALRRMLRETPENPMLHRQIARLLLIEHEDRAGGRTSSGAPPGQRRERAYAHVEKALTLDPQDPDSYQMAARVAWVFDQDYERALGYVERGLEIAPEDLTLLQLRSVVLERSLAPSSVTRAQDASVVESERILRIDPRDSFARQQLFGTFWMLRTSFVDAPLVGLAFMLFGVAGRFLDGHVGWLFFVVGFVLAAISTLFRVSWYSSGVAKMSPEFVRSVLRRTRFARVRTVLGRISWTAMIAFGLTMPFVRDAVVVRGSIAALGVAVLLALAASLLWHGSYIDASSRIAGANENTYARNGLAWEAKHRRQLRLRMIGRAALGLLAFFSLSVAPDLRDDARSTAFMALAAVVLPPLVGMISTGIAERRRVAALPEDNAVRITHRAPGLPRFVSTGIAAIVVMGLFFLNLTHLPVTPNEYDLVGCYRVSDDPCAAENRVEPATHEEGEDPLEDGSGDRLVIPTYEPIDLDSLDLSVFDPTTIVPTMVPAP